MTELNDLTAQLEREARQTPSAFPEQGELHYAERFRLLSGLLNKIHRDVATSAFYDSAQKIRSVIEGIIADEDEANEILKEWNEKGIPSFVYLNDHGPNHIEMVIRRASRLIEVMGCKLTPYEIYILLVAIHFHDVGNLYGRERHEQKIGDIMNRPEIKHLVGDATERRFIKLIAAAHGGYIREDKNTIGRLAEHDANLSYRVRLKYLAAILRFADELADDKSRASRFLLGGAMLEGSEIYHRYSNSLTSVSIEDKQVSLVFDLHMTDIIQPYTKGRENVFLIDEIFSRTIKMHSEAVYCMRFMRSIPQASYEGIIDSDWLQQIKPIETINVVVNIYESLDEGAPINTITYSLKEDGYPGLAQSDIYRLCPEINKQFEGKLAGFTCLNGQALKQIMEQTIGAMNP